MALQRIFRQFEIPVDARISTGVALAKALHDQQEYPTEFEALHEANSLKSRQVNWNAAAERMRADDIINAFLRPPSGSPDVTLGNAVILIVSLPRSGSTLIEQLLASHPLVEGANEVADLP